ncbi:hypothetical protein HPB51_018384 [Rhipicephalus microplus]|uniref:RING-type domain-containing protein n=1 Tax=Rhipicephalus microplus TaxID=6941 RepID=A0A9J6EUW7_RHIMP|nr:hypothetical protein HPB51_018384 [Rhipicephalus microplus]
MLSSLVTSRTLSPLVLVLSSQGAVVIETQASVCCPDFDLHLTADLANSTASEDDKIKAMMSQSSQEYDPSNTLVKASTYDSVQVEVKRSTGIPRSFMVTVDGPDHKGALLTSTGEFAVPLIDHQAYKEVKKEKPPFVREATPEPVQEPQLPDELLCMICHDLLQDAVLIPCCGNSFCDECELGTLPAWLFGLWHL